MTCAAAAYNPENYAGLELSRAKPVTPVTLKNLPTKEPKIPLRQPTMLKQNEVCAAADAIEIHPC